MTRRDDSLIGQIVAANVVLFALTLLAFLFFGRYFQGNYLGFVAAVATPVPFLVREARRAVERPRVRRRAPVLVERGSVVPPEPAAAEPAPAAVE